jgi:hypothetical protein
VEDPDIDQETKLFKCRGTAAFKCHHELGPYHLEVKGEKCDPSYDQWVLIWKLLSCSGAVHAEVIDNSLNDLIKKTKWYLVDDLMIGILMVANSKKVIPFIEDTWYLEESDLLCSVCLRPALRFFLYKNKKMRFVCKTKFLETVRQNPLSHNARQFSWKNADYSARNGCFCVPSKSNVI